MSKYRILALDGGGIKGIITAILLQRLNTDNGLNDWLESVDMLAGTSTGGLIALGLAHGITLQQIRDLYETKGIKIFDDSWLDNLLDLGQIIGAQYDNKNLERELKSLLGEKITLAQLQKKVLVTAFNLDNESADPELRTWKPKIFHNFPGEDSDGDKLAFEVALYTSAAPTYFPSVDGYIDGGVFANNPSMCALAQSQDTRIAPAPHLSEVVLLSVGTGTSLFHIEIRNKTRQLDWGVAQWAQPLVNIMMDGVSGIADYQCKQILREGYHRLSPVIPHKYSFSLDSVNQIPRMVEFAKSVDLSTTTEWLRKHWITE